MTDRMDVLQEWPPSDPFVEACPGTVDHDQGTCLVDGEPVYVTYTLETEPETTTASTIVEAPPPHAETLPATGAADPIAWALIAVGLLSLGRWTLRGRP